jgi:hypothetical protein
VTSAYHRAAATCILGRARLPRPVQTGHPVIKTGVHHGTKKNAESPHPPAPRHEQKKERMPGVHEHAHIEATPNKRGRRTAVIDQGNVCNGWNTDGMHLTGVRVKLHSVYIGPPQTSRLCMQHVTIKNVRNTFNESIQAIRLSPLCRFWELLELPERLRLVCTTSTIVVACTEAVSCWWEWMCRRRSVG